MIIKYLPMISEIDKIIYRKNIEMEEKDMKKIIILLVMAMTILMCSVEKTDKKETKNEDKLSQKVVVGLDDTFAPMGFKNEKGELIGFDIDLAKAVAEKLKIEVEFKPINWDSKIMDLNSGNIDLIWNGLTITPDRAKETEISKPYLSNNQIIIVNVNSPIKTKADLKGKVVGVQSQSSGEEKIKKENADKGFKELKTYPQYDQAFMDLGIGRLDAIVVDEAYAKYIKNTEEKQAGKELYRILDENFGIEEMGIAAKKGNKKLIEEIEKAIDELRKDGTYQKIYSKWFKD